MMFFSSRTFPGQWYASSFWRKSGAISNSFLLVFEGQVKINDEEIVNTDHFALFENNGESFTVEVTEDAVVFIVGGEPIGEPIAHYGPFVMNTKEELMEAFDDFNRGKFGTLK